MRDNVAKFIREGETIGLVFITRGKWGDHLVYSNSSLAPLNIQSGVVFKKKNAGYALFSGKDSNFVQT